jgi:hypothetical protein
MVQKMKNKPISADYIVGFIDGEGSFSLHINRHKKRLFGLCFTPSWSVSQNSTSKDVLQDIQSFFNCGFLRPDRKTSKLEVRDLDNLQKKIIPFFKKNPLRTQKKQDFLLFCEICDLLKKGEHLNQTGVLTLLDLAYSMNQSGVYRRKTKQKLISEIEEWKKKNLPICDKVKV